MKPIRLTIALLAIVSSSVSSLAGDSDVISFGEKYVSRNCTWCHGPSLQGFAISPRLAGQGRQYIENQLERLRSHSRNNPYSVAYMANTAASLSPETAHAVAVYLSTLTPETRADGNKDRAAEGEAIFQGGIPSSNVPACAFCHGPEAQGVREMPRLGGQSYYYLKRRLTQWNEGYSGSAEHMPGVASTLSPDNIEALASYLSFVK